MSDLLLTLYFSILVLFISVRWMFSTDPLAMARSTFGRTRSGCECTNPMFAKENPGILHQTINFYFFLTSKFSIYDKGRLNVVKITSIEHSGGSHSLPWTPRSTDRAPTRRPLQATSRLIASYLSAFQLISIRTSFLFHTYRDQLIDSDSY